MLAATLDGGRERLDGFFTMQTDPDDVRRSLSEAGIGTADLRVDDALRMRAILEAAERGTLAHVGALVVRPSAAAGLGQAKALMQAMLRELRERGLTHVFGEIYAIRGVNGRELERYVHNVASTMIQIQEGLGERIGMLREELVCGGVRLLIDWSIWASTVADAVQD